MNTESPRQSTKIDRHKVPTEIKYHRSSQYLELIYPDQKSFRLSSEYLRVNSPSAEVRGHTPAEAVLQYGKQYVNIIDIILQGSYAVRLSFDDKHDTGIYTWNYLWDLAENHASYWEQYLQALTEANKTRS